jgi:hypothetical protein
VVYNNIIKADGLALGVSQGEPGDVLVIFPEVSAQFANLSANRKQAERQKKALKHC